MCCFIWHRLGSIARPCAAVFEFLKKAVRARRNEGNQPPELPTLPLGCRLGGAVTIDDLPLRMLGEATLLSLPSNRQLIEARGEIDLGQGSTMHRMYLSDDLFLQINTEGSQVVDTKLFQFHDTQTPANRAALNAWLQPGSAFGRSSFSFGGHEYLRCWGGDSDEYAPPVSFEEQVYKQNVAENYSLTHYAMLYQRELPHDRFESLLISVEDAGPNDFAIVYSIGLDLSPADLEIV